jgi:hypothetical protein
VASGSRLGGRESKQRPLLGLPPEPHEGHHTDLSCCEAEALVSEGGHWSITLPSAAAAEGTWQQSALDPGPALQQEPHPSLATPTPSRAPVQSPLTP